MPIFFQITPALVDDRLISENEGRENF
jgi:hypothetical protein